ncbi:hypothetical protein [Nitrosomonas aestuarii]|uniref:hypothetical protein n=1 Tax=Nitrosomonas aestuarii TaxID=52441 RepID=UPI000D30AD5F|nr:hypothetical protein [Nitrosomonas aestuarii]PTN08866.1 hypothetical protein C8R11_1254 [Nitrosomonas aestuarii]
MNFEVDDLDWAMGELANLFANSKRTGIYPHELDYYLFHNAWGALCIQPFKIRFSCRQNLFQMLTEPYWKTDDVTGTVIKLTNSSIRYDL